MSRCLREGRGHCWKKGNRARLWLDLACLEVPMRKSLPLCVQWGLPVLRGGRIQSNLQDSD